MKYNYSYKFKNFYSYISLLNLLQFAILKYKNGATLNFNCFMNFKLNRVTSY